MRCSLSLAILFAIALPVLATEPNPSLRQRELIEKLLLETNSGSNATAIMDAILAQVEKQIVGEAGKDADQNAEAKELFAAFRERAKTIDFGALMHEAQVRIYARHFTDEELADLTAFYATPTGRKSMQLLPQLVTEGAQAGVENITPKFQEVMAAVMEEQEKKRPWRQTMADMRALATAIEAYSTDQPDDTYPAGDFAALRTVLHDGSFKYLSKFPEKDMWGNPYAYVVSEDRHHYRIISSGADSNFEWDSRGIVLPKAGQSTDVHYADRLEDDLIYGDGGWIQLPLQAKPKVITIPPTSSKPH